MPNVPQRAKKSKASSQRGIGGNPVAAKVLPVVRAIQSACHDTGIYCDALRAGRLAESPRTFATAREPWIHSRRQRPVDRTGPILRCCWAGTSLRLAESTSSSTKPDRIQLQQHGAGCCGSSAILAIRLAESATAKHSSARLAAQSADDDILCSTSRPVLPNRLAAAAATALSHTFRSAQPADDGRLRCATVAFLPTGLAKSPTSTLSDSARIAAKSTHDALCIRAVPSGGLAEPDASAIPDNHRPAQSVDDHVLRRAGAAVPSDRMAAAIAAPLSDTARAAAQLTDDDDLRCSTRAVLPAGLAAADAAETTAGESILRAWPEPGIAGSHIKCQGDIQTASQSRQLVQP